METAWIQVFILTLSQCIAPAGKMVCQQETVQYRFANADDCASALAELTDLAERSEHVLIDRDRSNCRPGTLQSSVYASADDARSASGGGDDFVVVDGKSPQPDFTQSEYADRLARTKTCEETNRVTPCKIGDIILEAATDKPGTEVWHRDN